MAGKLCEVSGARARGAEQADCGTVLETIGHGTACAGGMEQSSGGHF